MNKGLLNKAIDLQIISKVACNDKYKQELEDKYFNKEIRINQGNKSIVIL